MLHTVTLMAKTSKREKRRRLVKWDGRKECEILGQNQYHVTLLISTEVHTGKNSLCVWFIRKKMDKNSMKWPSETERERVLKRVQRCLSGHEEWDVVGISFLQTCLSFLCPLLLQQQDYSSKANHVILRSDQFHMDYKERFEKEEPSELWTKLQYEKKE